jgi:hypothetical protein
MTKGRPKVAKIWTDEKLNQVKDLAQHNTSSEIGEIFNTTKNAILGALYRDKIKNGYVPPPDSKYSKPHKNKYTFLNKHNYGERKCNICEKTFIKYSKFAVFCDNCRKNIS